MKRAVSSLRPHHHSTFRELDANELDEAQGGFVFAAAIPWILGAGGSATMLGIAANPSALAGTLTSATQTAYSTWRKLDSYFNPAPGRGAPGDTYHPAEFDPATGQINPARFEAPQTEPPATPGPSMPRSSEAEPAVPSETKVAQTSEDHEISATQAASDEPEKVATTEEETPVEPVDFAADESAPDDFDTA